MIRLLLLKWINRVIPKSNIILFNSFPDISDNSLALYRYIISYRKDICKQYRLIWTVSDNCNEVSIKSLTSESIGVKVVKKKSIYGLLCFVRAKYVVSTHGYFSGIGHVDKQTHIELWHGMPLKTIGRGIFNPISTGNDIDSDYTIATSELFKSIMAHAFGIDEDRVLITGLPRNDLLLNRGEGLVKIGITKKYDKVIIWMPTYRNSCIGDIRNDGDVNGFGLKDILFDSFERLNLLLAQNDYLLIIKPHPMDVLVKQDIPSSEHILVIRDDDLFSCDVSLYSLIADTDLLITDYSSVFVDYLITGKPIAFACSDMQEYSNTRGFFFDNIEEYMPGELLTTKDAFFDYLNDIDSYTEKWSNKYKKVRSLFNPMVDGNASKRVCDIVWGEADEYTD